MTGGPGVLAHRVIDPVRLRSPSRPGEQRAEIVTGVTESPISLRDAQLERLRTQLAVLQRAVVRYQTT